MPLTNGLGTENRAVSLFLNFALSLTKSTQTNILHAPYPIACMKFRGLMDKASDYESEDSRLDSLRVVIFFLTYPFFSQKK